MIHSTLLFASALLLLQAAAGVTVVNRAESEKLLAADAMAQKLAGGLQFVEGPVWVDAEGGYLVFSDIPANELKRWDSAGGVRTFRTPSGNTNGNTLDRDGRLAANLAFGGPKGTTCT